jgi:hypothetical protein
VGHSDERPVRATPVQQLGEAGLAHRQRQLTEITAIHGEHVKRLELDLMVALAQMQMTNCRCRFFNAASAIHGNRLVQL